MFDVPAREKTCRRWAGELPLDARPWNVGLIVGPSGCGKSSIMRQIWGDMPALEWGAASMLDDFDAQLSVEDIARTCGAVGFNTIPAWLRPFRVLSNGEQFRADLARRLCELNDPVVVDEFSSVVDRQVAQIGAHAVQKWARRGDRQFVAVTCHFDVVDWLQPDWVLEPATMRFDWRSLQPRPRIAARIERVPRRWWSLFAPYHYLTTQLHNSASCFGLFVDGGEHPVAFLATLHRPHATAHDIIGVSRVVVLPDWQGLGAAFVLMETIGAANRAIGKRLHIYPAHPPFVRSCGRSSNWRQVKRPGEFSHPNSPTIGVVGLRTAPAIASQFRGFGGRPCAVFRYDGAPMELRDAERLLDKTAAQTRRQQVRLKLRRSSNRVRRRKKGKS